MDQTDCDGFLSAARLAADLALSPEVADRWAEESACVEMTVGGLAVHLVSQVVNAVRLLEAGPSDQEPVSLRHHYDHSAWVNNGLEHEVNVAIRTSSDEQAAEGPEALRRLAEESLARLPAVLEEVPGERSVLIPWAGWSLTAHDILVTREMEMMVHSDDLASSVGLPTPEFPGDVVASVLALLTSVAVHRHGQVALVRALSRPQRAQESVSAF
jgi:hypothetical protein